MTPLQGRRGAKRKRSPPSSVLAPAAPEAHEPGAVLDSVSPLELHKLQRVVSPDHETVHHQSEVGLTSFRKLQHVDQAPASQLSLETLPVEIVNHIFSYLTLPRSRLPGLTEKESAYDFPRQQRNARKAQEDLEAPPDTERFAADFFPWTKHRHPFNALAATSRSCRERVENYCAHLVKACNKFNLPFNLVDKYGTGSVYPDMSAIVYRRLWLQVAPRPCLFCGAVLSSYPHLHKIRLLLSCEDCFYAQTLTLDEVKRQYHIADSSVLTANNVRRTPGFEWILRIDVEALALKLYHTRAFHDKDSRMTKEHCGICLRASAPQERKEVEPKRREQLPAHVRRRSRRQHRGRS